jgi:DNA polymerase I-like protein with 3'-5' exonuclease and polymerase domains
MRLAFDVETDGLLRELSTVHCLVTQDLDSGQVCRYDDTGAHESVTTGINILAEADELWGHNVVGYDFEAIREVYPYFNPKQRVYDTLILSRLFFTDILDRDFRSKPPNMPSQLYGRHSLESWGYRLGCLKSEYGKQLKGDWSTYTPEMLDYCAQDVEVSVALSQLFQPKLEKYADCIRTEHEIARLMSWQEREGFPFDEQKAHQLEGKLRVELEQLSDEMRSTFHFVDGGNFTPARPNQTRGYVTGAEFCRLKEFNPTSRHHIAFAFKWFRGWEPTEFTETGTPKIDETVLKELGTEESLKFGRILELQKHLGQLSEGANAWLKKVGKDGRIHHSCILNTATGRMAHMKPNLAQVPSDHEYRELFHAGAGRVQVGADASGLELRCLAHYLSRWDQGKFGKELLEGDIHTHLAQIYGTDRSTGKTVTYCMIYGGGDAKLGTSAGAEKGSATKRGKDIRAKVLANLAGFKQLSEAVTSRAESGVINGIDGRPIRIKKPHAALNYLLQSCGAVICKLWVIRANELLQEAGVDYWPLGFIHDEMQLSVHPDHVEQASFLISSAMKDVEYTLKFRCPLDSESKSGATWADCH